MKDKDKEDQFDIELLLPVDGEARLALYGRQAVGRAIGVVHINHGLAEHARRYGRFACALAEQGFHVYAHDHRGHGATTAPDAPQGRFAAENGANTVIDDVLSVHDWITGEHPQLPLILFGHSMGGLIAMNALAWRSQHLAGAAIWNANFNAGLLGRLGQALLYWEQFRLGSDVPSRMAPRLTFEAWSKAIPDARTAFDWLSRDASEVDKYINDPLCGWNPSVSMWLDNLSMVYSGASARNLADVRRNLPLHIGGGGDDPATSNGKAATALVNRLLNMGFSNVTAQIWPDTRHEGLNDIHRSDVTASFIDWATGVIQGAARSRADDRDAAAL